MPIRATSISKIGTKKTQDNTDGAGSRTLRHHLLVRHVGTKPKRFSDIKESRYILTVTEGSTLTENVKLNREPMSET